MEQYEIVDSTSLRNSLKNSSSFRQLVKTLRVLECERREQNLSPCISDTGEVLWKDITVFNSNYLSKTELIYACLLCYYLNTTKQQAGCPWALLELLVQLPEKIGKASYLSEQERNELWKLTIRSPITIDQYWPFSSRKLKGIINDPQIVRKLARRFYQKVHYRKAKRNQRHRGYRDQGTLRPSHRKLPKEDWTLTELQNNVEFYRAQCEHRYRLVQRGLRPVAVEEFPTLFDDPPSTN